MALIRHWGHWWPVQCLDTWARDLIGPTAHVGGGRAESVLVAEPAEDAPAADDDAVAPDAADDDAVASDDDVVDNAPVPADRNPFRQTRLVTADRRPLLAQTADDLRERLAEELSRWVSEAELVAEPIEQVDLYDLADAERDVAVIRAQDHLAYGLVSTELALALPLVAALCGGAAAPEEEIRPLTRIEASVFDLIVEATVNLAAQAFGVGPCQVAHHVVGAAALPSGTDEPALALPYRMTIGETTGLVTFAFPASQLQLHLEELDQRISGRAAERQRRSVNRSVARALVPVPVEVVVGFEPISVPTHQLAALAPGDVIRTGQLLSRSLVARIGSENLFYVRAAQRGQRLVAEVLGPTPSGKERI